jgi:hypothetical protein
VVEGWFRLARWDGRYDKARFGLPDLPAERLFTGKACFGVGFQTRTNFTISNVDVGSVDLQDTSASVSNLAGSLEIKTIADRYLQRRKSMQIEENRNYIAKAFSSTRRVILMRITSHFWRKGLSIPPVSWSW